MKGTVLILCGLLLPFSANAGRITMSNPEQSITKMVALCASTPIAFTRLPTSRNRNIARTAKASTRLIASKFQGYRCDTKWDTVCDTRQRKRYRCLTYG